MRINSVKRTWFVAFVTAMAAPILFLGCGSSPSSPSATSLSVSLSATTLAPGATVQGTVALSAAASSAASVALTSTNANVATVQTPVTIQAGSSSASFTVTGVAPGTVTIRATVNGSSADSPTLTVAGTGVALASISLSASTVVGGNSVTGTATLTGPAPAGGAIVSLSAADPITVPASVTVPASTTSATFPVTTRAVGGTIPGTITGSYGGASASASLSVTKPTVATARFGVTGPTESDTCTLTNNGNTLNCTFNGSSSTAPGNIVAYDWSYSVATTFSQTTTGPQLTMPAVNCSFVPAPPLPPGTSSFNMTVTLVIHDDQGNTAQATDSGVRLLPQGSCGF